MKNFLVTVGSKSYRSKNAEVLLVTAEKWEAAKQKVEAEGKNVVLIVDGSDGMILYEKA